jgi:mRNA-degrading endonuclease RelE of RelBE toxin-antitoxin system
VAYEIRFAQCVRDHMKFLTSAESSTVLDAIREQLAHEPLVETRNRKPLRPNPLAPWELRVGPLRAFYEVRPRTDVELEAPADVVYVLAVGKKERTVLRIAGEVVKL